MSDTQQPEQQWRWPIGKNFSPTSLKTYAECPSRVKMYYLQNLEPPYKWVRHFALGRSTHNALRTVAQQLKTGSELISDDQIRFLCRFEMPIDEYPTEEAREADIQTVIHWVHKGRDWLQSLDIDEWMLIEAWAQRDFTMFQADVPYAMITKPDLVLKRVDEEGVEYFHIIDWKTGSVWELPDVPIIMRFALREYLEEWVGDANSANVQFTWYWLDHDVRKDVDVSMELVSRSWPDIVEQMTSLALETDWIATPGSHCRFCPYYQNFCPEEIPPEID